MLDVVVPWLNGHGSRNAEFLSLLLHESAEVVCRQENRGNILEDKVKWCHGPPLAFAVDRAEVALVECLDECERLSQELLCHVEGGVDQHFHPIQVHKLVGDIY